MQAEQPITLIFYYKLSYLPEEFLKWIFIAPQNGYFIYLSLSNEVNSSL